MTTAAADVRLGLLNKAPLDSWVALSEDETRIVAVGATYEEAARKSELAGVGPSSFEDSEDVVAAFGVTLKLPYKTFPLRGGGTTATAVLNVSIALTTKNAPRTKRFEAVIDSGASRCIFHESLGRFIGLDIEKGTMEETLSVNGVTSA